jgi:hypothetical protein
MNELKYANLTSATVLYGFLPSGKEEGRLQVFQQMVLQNLFGLRMKYINRWMEESYIITNFVICILHQILLGSSYQA